MGLVVVVGAVTLIDVGTIRRCCAEPARPTPAMDDGLTPPATGGVAAGVAAAADPDTKVPRPHVPAQAARRSQVQAAVLIIRLTTGWARIYVDGELRGERPVHREGLPPGTHTLRFERPGFRTLDTTLTLRAGQNLIEIQLPREGP